MLTTYAKIFFVSALLTTAVQADIYNLISYDAEQDGGVLSGTIETDGSLLVTESSILSWSYTIVKPGGTYSLTSSDTDTQTLLQGGSTLFVENGDLKLDGLLRFGRYFGNSGGNETSLNWATSGVTKVYDAVREGNASPWGWAAVNPSSLGPSPWTIASIPEPSVIILFATFGSGILICKRIFKHNLDSNA